MTCFNCKIDMIDGFSDFEVYRGGRKILITFIPSFVCLRCQNYHANYSAFCHIIAISLLNTFINIVRLQSERKEFDYLYIEELIA